MLNLASLNMFIQRPQEKCSHFLPSYFHIFWFHNASDGTEVLVLEEPAQTRTCSRSYAGLHALKELIQKFVRIAPWVRHWLPKSRYHLATVSLFVNYLTYQVVLKGVCCYLTNVLRACMVGFLGQAVGIGEVKLLKFQNLHLSIHFLNESLDVLVMTDFKGYLSEWIRLLNFTLKLDIVILPLFVTREIQPFAECRGQNYGCIIPWW